LFSNATKKKKKGRKDGNKEGRKRKNKKIRVYVAIHRPPEIVKMFHDTIDVKAPCCVTTSRHEWQL
jgi:hypothetical protein